MLSLLSILPRNLQRNIIRVIIKTNRLMPSAFTKTRLRITVSLLDYIKATTSPDALVLAAHRMRHKSEA
jgi:hypothetical protein